MILHSKADTENNVNKGHNHVPAKILMLLLSSFVVLVRLMLYLLNVMSQAAI